MKSVYIIFLLTYIVFATDIKVATYNVENLFDNVNNGTEYKEYKPNQHNWSRAIFNKKLQNITRVICELNADVLALQEIENKNALESLLALLKRSGCEYKYSAITDKKGSAIQVALISKIKLKSSKSIVVTRRKSDRDILEVTLDLEPKLTLFVNHWRSKRAPESARLRYAKALVKRLNKLPSSQEYIILGDFNSAYNECSKITERNNDTNGICGVDTILKTYRNNSLLKLRDKATFPYNYNLWSQAPSHKRWSHDYYGKKGALDSIIISANLVDNNGWFYKSDSFKVFKKRYLFKKQKNMLNAWEYKNSKHTGKGYSDHLPIYAYFSNSKQTELKHESLLDKLWKTILPKPTNNKKLYAKEIELNKLSKIRALKEPVTIKRACVIYKRGETGVVKNGINTLPFMLYKCAEAVKEGRCYKLKVYKKKRYYGIEEILDLDIKKELDKINISKFIKKFNILEFKNYRVGDIVKDIKGVYKEHYLYINNSKIRLFVKQKRKGLLRKNNKLYIKKAQIGYYKGEKELIIYSSKDIQKED
jgi:exonuclease III